MNAKAGLAVVYVSQGPLAAEVVKAKLESQGIPVMLRYASIGRILGLTVDGLGRVEVVVPLAYEATAKELLEEDSSSPEEPSEQVGWQRE